MGGRLRHALGRRRQMHPVRFAALLLLSTGAAAAAVVLGVLVTQGDASRTVSHLHLDGTLHAHDIVNAIPVSSRADHPLEAALVRAGLPSADEVPPSAEPLPSAPGYLESLRTSADPIFAPWAAYLVASRLLGITGWTEATGARVAVAIYPAADVPLAQAALESLQIADPNAIFEMTTAPGLLQEFRRLTIAETGDAAEGYTYRYESNLSRGGVPEFAGEVSTLWTRVGGSIFFVNRVLLAFDGEVAGADPDGAPIDIRALARGIAERMAAWDTPAAAAGPAPVGP